MTLGIEKANVFWLRSQNLGTATAAVSSSSKVWRSSTQRSPELAWLPGLFSHQHLVWLVVLTILKNISYLESLKPPTSSHLPSPSRRLTPHPQARYFATSQARLLLNVPTEIQQGFDHESAILRAPGHAPCPVAVVRLESEDGLLTCGFLRMPCLPPGHHHFYRWYVYQCQSWMVHDCFGEMLRHKTPKTPHGSAMYGSTCWLDAKVSTPESSCEFACRTLESTESWQTNWDNSLE